MRQLIAISLVLYSCVGCANAFRFPGVPLADNQSRMIVTPAVRQDKTFQCGYAAMASVAMLHGIERDAILDESILEKYGNNSVYNRPRGPHSRLR